MALTFDQEKEVKRRLMRGDSVFRVAIDLGHSPHTVRKRKRKFREELAGGGKPQPVEAPAAFIPVNLRLLLEMASENAIDLDYQALLPVPLEIAARYVEVQKSFAELKPLMDRMAEDIRKGVEEHMTSRHRQQS